MSDWDLRSASAQTPQQRQSSNTGAGSGDPILEDRMMTVDGDLAMDEEDVEEIDLRDEHDDDDAAADPAAAAASSASSPSKAHPPLNKTTSGGVSSRLAAFMRKAQTPAAVVVVPASPSAAPTALASAPGVADAHGSIPPSPMASQPGSPQPTSSAMFTNLKSVFHRRTPSGASTTSAAVAAGLASGHAGTEKGAVAMSALPEDMLIPAEVASLGSTGPPSATVSYGGSDFDRTSFTHVSGEGSSLVSASDVSSAADTDFVTLSALPSHHGSVNELSRGTSATPSTHTSASSYEIDPDNVEDLTGTQRALTTSDQITATAASSSSSAAARPAPPTLTSSPSATPVKTTPTTKSSRILGFFRSGKNAEGVASSASPSSAAAATAAAASTQSLASPPVPVDLAAVPNATTQSSARRSLFQTSDSAVSLDADSTAQITTLVGQPPLPGVVADPGNAATSGSANPGLSAPTIADSAASSPAAPHTSSSASSSSSPSSSSAAAPVALAINSPSRKGRPKAEAQQTHLARDQPLTDRSAVLPSQASFGLYLGGGAPLCPIVYITSIVPGSPAARANPALAIGDELVALGATALAGQTVDAVLEMLGGTLESVDVTFVPFVLDYPPNLRPTQFDVKFKQFKQSLSLKFFSSKASAASPATPAAGTGAPSADAASANLFDLLDDAVAELQLAPPLRAQIEAFEQSAVHLDGSRDKTAKYIASLKALSEAQRKLAQFFSDVATRNEPDPVLTLAMQSMASTLLGLQAEVTQFVVTMEPIFKELAGSFLRTVTDVRRLVKRVEAVCVEGAQVAAELKTLDTEEQHAIRGRGGPLERTRDGNIRGRDLFVRLASSRTDYRAASSELASRLASIQETVVPALTAQLERIVRELACYLGACKQLTDDAQKSMHDEMAAAQAQKQKRRAERSRSNRDSPPASTPPPPAPSDERQASSSSSS